MAKDARPYEEGLYERLRGISHAANYISAAVEDGSIDGFLLALRDVAEATKGMTGVANAADRNRENLYRMLSKDGNPRLDSLWAVLHAMGLRISVAPLAEAQTGGGRIPIGAEFLQGAKKFEEGNSSLSGAADSGRAFIGYGMSSVPAQGRKGLGRALENFALVGHAMNNEQRGVLVGRQ